MNRSLAQIMQLSFRAYRQAASPRLRPTAPQQSSHEPPILRCPSERSPVLLLPFRRGLYLH